MTVFNDFHLEKDFSLENKEKKKIKSDYNIDEQLETLSATPF